MDLDAFFASCEQQEHPEYRGRPVVVGAQPGNRGVVAASSYEAREFGIRSAMPISEAYRRCPDAVYLRPDIAKYSKISRQVFQILETITPAVEAASIDEAYLDISGLDKLMGLPETIGHEIKQRILSDNGSDGLRGYRSEPADRKTRFGVPQAGRFDRGNTGPGTGLSCTHAGVKPPRTGTTDTENL